LFKGFVFTDPVKCGAGDAFTLVMGNGTRGQLNGMASFDLDEGNHIAFFRDDVDLANGCSVALCQNAITPEPQPNRRQVLAENPALVTGTSLRFIFGLDAY